MVWAGLSLTCPVWHDPAVGNRDARVRKVLRFAQDDRFRRQAQHHSPWLFRVFWFV